MGTESSVQLRKKEGGKAEAVELGMLHLAKTAKPQHISFAVQIVDKFDDFHRWVNTISKF
jgi:hypothetical protein